MIHGCRVARQAPIISHILFADDCYDFFRAKEEEAFNLLKLFSLYEQALGQKLNPLNSSIFFSSNVLAEVRDNICRLIEIYEADSSTTYLGLPNILGRNRMVILGFLKDRLRRRIQV